MEVLTQVGNLGRRFLSTNKPVDDMLSGWYRLTQPGTVDLRALLDSEQRRRDLEVSLAQVQNALQKQRVRMLHRMGPGSQHALPQMLVLNLGQIKRPVNLHPSLFSGSNYIPPYGDLYTRVGRLELDLEIISAQLDQVLCSGGKRLHGNGPPPQQDSLTPCQREDHNMTSQLIAQAVDKGQLLKERDNLERLLEDSRAQLQLMEQGREAQIAALHSQLYQARSSLQETHRGRLATQAELHGSKQINESLLQEVASLRRRPGAAEERASLMESDGRLLRARIAALETEREELLQQGHLATGRRQPSAFGSAWEMDVEDAEKSKEGVREESAVEEEDEDEENYEEERVEGKNVSVDLRLQIHEVPLSKPGPHITEENQDREEKGPGLVDRWNPWQHEPIEANQMNLSFLQMTALIIELQQLRTACEETSSTLPVSPKGQRVAGKSCSAQGRTANPESPRGLFSQQAVKLFF
ncbi:golgin subfamily A member 1 isoform X3 [Coregonus clupeaformis]|uniref:golgin subfamily A member 1 isoform X3 n=1 Tax=Coregonus clupeaformis TaxID=59861 RepID=UPI001BDFC4D1|nr:golgin subfamily A member 1 isoform X3 [Coregonus clupeaformis]